MPQQIPRGTGSPDAPDLVKTLNNMLLMQRQNERARSSRAAYVIPTKQGERYRRTTP